MILKKLNQKKTIVYILILALIILLIPSLVRLLFYGNTLIGQEAYYHLRISESIKSDPFFSQDTLSFNGSNYIKNPYHYLLAGLSLLVNLKLIMILLPIILGALSIYLFYKILLNIKSKKSTANLSSFLLLLSPIFIYLFTFPNLHYIPVFLNILVAHLFLTKAKTWKWAILPTLLVPLFGPSHTIILFFSLIFLSRYKKEYKSRAQLIIISLIASSLFYYIPLLIKHGFPYRPDFINTNIFNSFITDFGALISFSIFFLFLAAIGLIMINKKHESLPIYIGSLILFALSYYIPQLRFYINFLLVFLVTFTFIQFIRRKWKIKLIKKLTLLVIILALLFTTITYIHRVSTYEPTKEISDSLEWLRDQPKGVVLSHYSNGFWIEQIAEKPTLTDSLFSYSSNPKERYADSQTIFLSHIMDETTSTLDKYSITYIWINQEMKNGQVWNKENQGLLLILENSPRFKQIYFLNGIEIWTYLG